MTSTTPALPDGYAWAHGLDHAHQLLADRTVALLATGDRDRDQRIADALARYGPPTGPLPRPAGACARVVSIGGSAQHRLGALAAAALGRPHHPYPDLEAALADPGPAGGSVLLTAAAPDLTLAQLLPAHNTWTGRGTRLGLLTGRDLAAAVFLLAKILATPSTPGGPSALIDGTTGRSRHLGDPNGPKLTTSAALTGSWRTLLVDAHGSAAHANLGTAVLCGLPGPTERTLDGQAIPGGCTTTGCKTDATGRLTIHHPHDLEASVLGLWVCNAITLGPTEQFPSTVNLALDAVDGHPAAVLGLVRGDADTTGGDPAAAAELLHTGADLGTVVADQNRRAAERGLAGGAAVLLGDPDHRPHPVRSDRPAPPAPRTIHPRPRTAPAPDHDAALRAWALRTNEANLFETALRDSITHRPDPDLARCLDDIQAPREQAQTLLRRAAAGGNLDLPHLEQLARQWAGHTLSILTRTRGGAFSRQLTALRAHHRLQHTAAATPCPHCGAPRRAEHLTSPLGPADRITAACPRCGPAESRPHHQTAFHVDAPTTIHPGRPFTLTLTTGPDQGLVAVHLRPRATRLGTYAHTTSTLDHHPPTLTLRPPIGLLPELDRLWIIHADRFRLALYQQRVPVLPAQCHPGSSTAP
ncbi:hypothetical protein [Kitasatospora sp. NPDC088779]|uniref:hypothetical protein n=1 Tax=Kitasatospora sp. NPDC088779 TaxID=3154964 RepID=UPI003412CFF2